jgi:hypothetical protein
VSAHKQLRMIRATLALLLAQVDSLADEFGTEACEHPERERDTKVATFDEPGRWQCRRCGHIGGEKAAEKE